MGVVDPLADLDEQLEPASQAQAVLAAVASERDPVDVLHHEVRPARPGRSRVVDPGDVRMIHQRERLALGLEPRDHLVGVHAQLDHLDGDLAAQRRALRGEVDHPHAALAQTFEDLVRPQRLAGQILRRGHVEDGGVLGPGVVVLEQAHHLVQQVVVIAALAGQERGAFGRIELQRALGELLDPAVAVIVHRPRAPRCW